MDYSCLNKYSFGFIIDYMDDCGFLLKITIYYIYFK